MITPLKSLFILFCTCFALVACVSTQPYGSEPTIEVADLDALPAPTGLTEHIIGTQETLEIVVSESELLSGTYITDGSGYISYPLVGDLYLQGKTTRQAAKIIADRLRGDYVIDPQVRVQATSLGAPSISVGGQVSKPGSYPAVSSPTLLRAVNNAGGLADYAKKDDVLVIREVDGRRYIGAYNIQAIQRGNYTDPRLYPGDIVTVGDSVARRNLETVLGFIPLLSTSVVLVDRVLN
ncbi:polysaccharide biosynthesis/export family protein [Pontixanthobacter sp.]|uniref:polysaccharide biosynthesis/export family protein n=1 Tax=Pontixanthobacter sp. TaxID=2792078 RepID=UPI003C7B9949